MFKLSDLAELSKEVSKVTQHENFDLKYVEEGLDVENIDQIEEALLSPGQQKYKAAKALISRLKAKDKSGQKLSPEDYKKLQNALTFVSQTDRAGAMKKSGGKTDGITKVREDVELEESFTYVVHSEWMEGKNKGKILKVSGKTKYETSEEAKEKGLLYNPIGHVYKQGSTGNRYKVVKIESKPMK